MNSIFQEKTDKVRFQLNVRLSTDIKLQLIVAWGRFNLWGRGT